MCSFWKFCFVIGGTTNSEGKVCAKACGTKYCLNCEIVSIRCGGVGEACASGTKQSCPAWVGAPGGVALHEPRQVSMCDTPF